MATVLNETYGTSTAMSFASASWTQATVVTSLPINVAGLATTPYDLQFTLTFGVTAGGASLGAQKAVNLWFISSEDGSTYPDSQMYSGNAVSSAALLSPTNWSGPFVVSVSSAIQQTAMVTSALAVLGARTLPRKLAIASENQTNVTLGSCAATYTPITYTNV